MGRTTAFGKGCRTCSVLAPMLSVVKERGSFSLSGLIPVTDCVEGCSRTSGANCGRLRSLIWNLLTKILLCCPRLILLFPNLTSGRPQQACDARITPARRTIHAGQNQFAHNWHSNSGANRQWSSHCSAELPHGPAE